MTQAPQPRRLPSRMAQAPARNMVARNAVSPKRRKQNTPRVRLADDNEASGTRTRTSRQNVVVVSGGSALVLPDVFAGYLDPALREDGAVFADVLYGEDVHRARPLHRHRSLRVEWGGRKRWWC